MGLFSFKKTRLSWDLMVTLNYIMRVAELLRGAQREMTKGTRHNLYQGKFLLCLRKKFFTRREMQS